MKKTWIVPGLALTLVLATAVSTTPTAEDPRAEQKRGTIKAWDGAAKTVTIKDAAGRESSFAWNEKTKVHGVAKLGERVTVSYSKDKEGKSWATLISVDPAPESKKSPAGK